MSLEAVSEARIEKADGSQFQVHGAMTFEHAKVLLQQSEKLFVALPEIEIDLSQVEKADSAGLALMLEWMAWAAERETKVSFIGVPEAILSIAHLCQIESLLDGYIAHPSQV
ncbi:MAG: STAS domain-containing protein [Candidatus Thiodiazotropha sp. 6PLUC2]